MKIVNPKILILSNKFDFSTDLITNKLRENDVEFLRLNKDQLNECSIDFDPIQPILKIYFNDNEYIISEETLKTIYYRAPTFLRDIFQSDLSTEEQLYRTQAAAFVRSLIVFEKIKWVNDPVATYRAEIKPYQLFLANKVGFNVPKTVVTNRFIDLNMDILAVKSIDTAFLTEGDSEAFIYTSIINKTEIADENYGAPFFIQQGLIPKIDIRVTIIGDHIIAASIDSDEGINIDWRQYKGKLNYKIIELPIETKNKCLQFSKALKLNFCAIDFALHNNQYYFIEVNPTGEWMWLQKNTDVEFDTIISEFLTKES